MKLLVLASLAFSTSAFATVEESEKPERLRDRLINIENTVSDYKSLAAQSNDEFKSLSVRMKHFETLLHDIPHASVKPPKVKKRGSSQIQPYEYVSF
ncbi:hypothetical protein [Pseudoalteromonas marina]|uniref:Uncharacterized protein n=1 Tax=Pseudoalteromonas marina TaxID=267375 RepID=A0ABT9FC51_9GAMM|nr:hypothetical protein [Pseudoalteromonas marina]MDP2564362.1 hypothetical protein [Pseudoalteromonas marina]